MPIIIQVLFGKKAKSFFLSKYKNLHHGVCSYGEDYVGETKRNMSISYNEHKPSKKLKLSVIFEKKNIDHLST